MRSAGLKNITAKHLGQPAPLLFRPCAALIPSPSSALASQSLSIMVALIPYIRETLRRHLNPKQAVMLVEFDRLKRVRSHPLPPPPIHRIVQAQLTIVRSWRTGLPRASERDSFEAHRHHGRSTHTAPEGPSSATSLSLWFLDYSLTGFLSLILQEIDFEAPSKRPGKPNEYVELLVKETAQLHKILSRYLPDQVVEVNPSLLVLLLTLC